MNYTDISNLSLIDKILLWNYFSDFYFILRVY